MKRTCRDSLQLPRELGSNVHENVARYDKEGLNDEWGILKNEGSKIKW